MAVGVRPPCSVCRHDARCKAERLACDAFAVWRSAPNAKERWGRAPRLPTHARFLALIEVSRRTANP